MLVIVALSNGELTRFNLGAPLETSRDPEAQLRWVLADYERRRDEQWQVPPPVGEPILAQLFAEAGADPGRLLPLVRAFGFYAMPDHGPKLLPPLLRDPPLRMPVIQALGSMGAHASARDLTPFLDDPDPGIRRETVVALGKLGLTDVIPALERAAGADPGLGPLVEQARKRIDAADRGQSDELVDLVIQTDTYEDLGILVPFIWRRLVTVVESPARGEAARARALRLLGLARARKGGPAALAVLESPDASPAALQREAVIALGRMRFRRAVPPAIELLGSADAALQEAAIEALGLLGDGRALQGLLNRYYDRGGGLRERIRLAARRLARPLLEPDYLAWARGDTTPTAAAVLFFSDALAVSLEVPLGVLPRLVEDPRPEVRREATALLALGLRPEESGLLARIAHSETDDLARTVAARAHAALLGDQSRE